ncbi:c-di-GMP phosphodiesterase A-related protein [Marinomonas sp. MED121]|uniref:EAL domain-containing protein n=1 Tax=Marinomonas sp. MED121 TaxID=314277 RepID=UPI00006902D9|nr:EAL domain-containing protein [Marinomonas sp. MED121]EAQ66367.1 c-di-GMP phosphodiesterase A-related protein [Marinomonas sp. MED121]
MAIRIKDRASVKHAQTIIIASLILSLVFGVLQAFLDLESEKQQIHNRFSSILLLSHDPAAQAAYQLNSPLAKQVIKGLLSHPDIIQAEIMDDFDSQLASDVDQPSDENEFTQFLANYLFSKQGHLSIPLIFSPKNINVGSLSITLDSQAVAKSFIGRATNVFLLSLIKNLILSLILLAFFYKVLTHPLTKLTIWISSIKYNNKAIDNPPIKIKKDEFGLLIKQFMALWKERESAEAQLREYAYFDLLTGLSNRRHLSDILHNAIIKIQHQPTIGALFYMDLDRFKHINDSLGHAVGDALLVTIGKRLSEFKNDDTSVARLGGDEFVILIPDIADTEEKAHEAATQLANKILTSIAEPHTLIGHLLYTSASIGISIIRQDSNTGQDVLRHADIALYKAKAEGGNTYHFYENQLHIQAEQRLSIEQGLHSAIENNEFYLAYQAQCNKDGDIIGAECLARWKHPVLGEISPGDFIPISEETRQIYQLGDWVLKTAFLQVTKWLHQGLPHKFTRLAINISPIQFQDPNFVERVQELLVECKCPPQLIELEITESCLFKDEHLAKLKVEQLKDMGLSLSLDDFGTGYSSLRHLRELKLDVIKIDQSLIRDLHLNEIDKDITDSILSLAQKLNMKVVAEGVENQEEMSALLELGCEFYQGFYFSKPINAEAFEKLVFEDRKSVQQMLNQS